MKTIVTIVGAAAFRAAEVLSSRRARLGLRLLALILLVFRPLAVAVLQTRHDGILEFEYPEVAPSAVSDPGGRDGQTAARVARYLSDRDPVVDRLLPGGAGGVRFFEHLDGDAGRAFIGAASIGLAAGDYMEDAWAESVELHERAHLVEAYLPEITGRLMARMPPAAGGIAAESSGQHFAEMAPGSSP